MSNKLKGLCNCVGQIRVVHMLNGEIFCFRNESVDKL